MHYLQDGDWVDATGQVELLPEGQGAVSRRGQLQVTFAPNINTPGAITTTTPDNKRFVTHVLGLALTDDATGKSVLIAPVKDAVGAIRGNQVAYRDAFENLRADIVYTCTKGKFEQDIVLRENIPFDPARIGFAADKARLEVWTEVVEAPEPIRRRRVVAAERDAAARAAMTQPDLVDETLDFGATTIGRGRAFTTENHLGGARPFATPVAKLWTRTDNRRFLVERVDYLTIKTELDNLPPSASTRTPEHFRDLVSLPRNGQIERSFPAAPEIDFDKGSMQLASVIPSEPGFVIDYAQLVTASNFTFAANQTYLLLDTVSLSGTTVLEGSAVIKATNSNQARIIVTSTLDCRTDFYNPAIFTAMSDDTVGAQIAGSTGNPATNWFGAGLELWASNSVLKNVRFSFAESAVDYENASTKIANAQFVKCRWPITTLMDFSYEPISVDNALFDGSEIVMSGGTFGFYGRNLTINNCGTLGSFDMFGGDIWLTNCLLVNVTNRGNVWVSTNSTVELANATNVFQELGGGHFYLSQNSPYRNLGDTNVDADFRRERSLMSTWPPVLLTNTVAVNTTLRPTVSRDTDAIDLGYAYAAADYVVRTFSITNATLTLAGGVVLLHAGDTGIWLQDRSSLVSEGTPTAPNRICRYTILQEQSTNWFNASLGNQMAVNPYNYGAAPSARFRFTHFNSLANGGHAFNLFDSSWIFTSLSLRDCEFNGGSINFGGAVTSTNSIVNNLFNGVDVLFQYYPNISAYNNLFRGGWVGLLFYGGGPWVFKDNVFHSVQLDDYLGGTANDFNAFIDTPGRFYPGQNTNDVVLTNLIYGVGPLGHFYQPTNTVLFNSGTASNAASLGFYHFSVAASGKEATSRLDRGYHYVATDPATGRPYDSDSDGVEDWAEDADGDGAIDSGETDWNSSTDTGLSIMITRPQAGSNLP